MTGISTETPSDSPNLLFYFKKPRLGCTSFSKLLKLWLCSIEKEILFVGKTSSVVEEEQKGNSKAEYGTGLLKELAEKLTKEHGKSFSDRNLRHIRQFYTV
ncbi:MAG: hypothetical protein HRT71_16275, partial [Flavobacteriales bacterium]|nr:hypothetical protein [Flavobacteriales bacterium]